MKLFEIKDTMAILSDKEYKTYLEIKNFKDIETWWIQKHLYPKILSLISHIIISLILIGGTIYIRNYIAMMGFLFFHSYISSKISTWNICMDCIFFD